MLLDVATIKTGRVLSDSHVKNVPKHTLASALVIILSGNAFFNFV